MRKILMITAIFCSSAVPVFADSHTAPQPVVVVEAPPPSGSINSGYIVLGALALLILATADF